MGSINFWNLRGLHSKKVVFLVSVFVFLLNIKVDAQINRHNYNYLDFQKKPFYFGLSLGINSSKFDVRQSSDFINNESVYTVAGVSRPGFIVHMIGNLKIGEYFDFRFVPGFSFTTRELVYNSVESNAQIDRKMIESVFFESPFLIRFKSAPYKDKRAFVVTGIKYAYDVQSNSMTRQRNELIQISPHDFQFEIGAGVQFFLPFFIFSPEIKYSQGISSTHLYNGNLNQSLVLDKIYSRTLTISFNFEG